MYARATRRLSPHGAHTDIENSTFLARHLREQYPVVLETHRTLLRAAFTAYEGWEVDTQEIRSSWCSSVPPKRLPPRCRSSVPLRLRRGAGRGRARAHRHPHREPIRTTEGYTGLDVIRGARIKEAGHGGQVLLSASTAAIVQDALLDELGLRDLGAHRLKSLPRPERIFQLLILELQPTSRRCRPSMPAQGCGLAPPGNGC